MYGAIVKTEENIKKKTTKFSAWEICFWEEIYDALSF